MDIDKFQGSSKRTVSCAVVHRDYSFIEGSKISE